MEKFKFFPPGQIGQPGKFSNELSTPINIICHLKLIHYWGLGISERYPELIKNTNSSFKEDKAGMGIGFMSDENDVV